MLTAVSAVAVVIALVNAPPRSNCETEAPISHKEYRVSAIQTVTQPWRGPHHVYGIFVIPDRYKYDHLYSAKLTIQGVESEFVAGSSEDEDPDLATKEPGHYVKRVYVSTRTALWFLLTGRFGDLRTSCHWRLVLVDRGWQPTSRSH